MVVAAHRRSSEPRLARRSLPGLLAVCLGSLYLSGQSPELRTACLVALVSFAFSAVVASRHTAGGAAGPVTLTVMAMGLFHLGLAPYILLGLAVPTFDSYANEQLLLSPYLAPAILLSSAGIAALTIGAVLAKRPPAAELGRPSRAHRARAVGVALSGAGVGMWLYWVLGAGGLSLLGANYGQFLSTTEGLPLPYAYWLLALGAVFVSVSRPRSWNVLAYAPLGLFVVLGTALGMRSEVAIPLAGVVVPIALARPKPIPLRTVLAVLLLALLVAGLVREYRQPGNSYLSLLSPLPVFLGAAEMGYSIRPVALVLQWLAEGDVHQYGATYWAPVERLLSQLSSFVEVPPADEDHRLMNVVIADRAGPYGFSSVAEAFWNFGHAGVVIVMASFGLLLSWASARARGPAGVATAAALTMIVLLHTRNSFTPVVFQLLTGVAAIGLVYPPMRVRRIVNR